MVSIPGILAVVLVAGFWLLGLAAVVYALSQLRSLTHGLRRLQTEIEELRRDLRREEK